MKVSVAMTTYNGEKYILEQLESMKNQDMQIDELFICDDGSSDNTVAIVSDYIQKNNLQSTWHLIVNEKNLGYADNFNKGINMCTGEYIFFADQDDIWNKDKISSVVKVMENDKKIQVLCSDYEPYYCTDDAPVIAKEVTDRMTGDDSIEQIKLNNWSIYIRSEGCCMAMRKFFWDRVKSYWYSGWAHDEFIWEMAHCEEGIYNYHHSTLKRRLHSNNVSKRKMHDLNTRITFSKELAMHQNKMLEYASVTGMNKTSIDLICNTKRCLELRIEMMEKKRLLNIFPLVFRYQKFYYSKKSIPTEFVMTLKG